MSHDCLMLLRCLKPPIVLHLSATTRLPDFMAPSCPHDTMAADIVQAVLMLKDTGGCSGVRGGGCAAAGSDGGM